MKLLNFNLDEERLKVIVHDLTTNLNSLRILMKPLPTDLEPTSYIRLLSENPED